MSIGAPRGTVRVKTLHISLTAEEYEAIFHTADYEDKKPATWARDVLLSRVLQLAWSRR